MKQVKVIRLIFFPSISLGLITSVKIQWNGLAPLNNSTSGTGYLVLSFGWHREPLWFICYRVHSIFWTFHQWSKTAFSVGTERQKRPKFQQYNSGRTTNTSKDLRDDRKFDSTTNQRSIYHEQQKATEFQVIRRTGLAAAVGLAGWARYFLRFSTRTVCQLGRRPNDARSCRWARVLQKHSAVVKCDRTPTVRHRFSSQENRWAVGRLFFRRTGFFYLVFCRPLGSSSSSEGQVRPTLGCWLGHR